MTQNSKNIHLFLQHFTLCYVLPFFLLEFPQKMLRDIRSRLTNLEVSYDFPDTLKSTGGLYWGVSTIFSHFWLNYFYAMGKNLKNQDLKNGGAKFYKWWGKIFNFVFYLKNGWCLSRVTQKYHFFKKILSFSAPNSPLKF